jgi:hypothetical protein
MQVEQLEDPLMPAIEVVQRCRHKQLMQLYKVPAYEGAEQLLGHIALARGKLHKGGTPDLEVRCASARRPGLLLRVRGHSARPWAGLGFRCNQHSWSRALICGCLLQLHCLLMLPLRYCERA